MIHEYLKRTVHQVYRVITYAWAVHVHCDVRCESACGIRQLWSFYKKLPSVSTREHLHEEGRGLSLVRYSNADCILECAFERLLTFFFYTNGKSVIFVILIILLCRLSVLAKNTFYKYAVTSCRSLTFPVLKKR